MKAKTGFNLRTVCGENIIVAEGKENIDFSNIISMNESSAYLWQQVQEKESFSVDDLVELLRQEYEVDEATARKDSQLLAAQWGKAGIIEGDDIPAIEVSVVKDLTQPGDNTTTDQATAKTASKKVTSASSSQAKPARKPSFLKRLFGRR